MYVQLTALLPALQSDNYGEWIIDRENDGTPEHPIQFPFVNYGEVVRKLEEEIYHFEQDHPDFGLNRYGEILKKNEIEWCFESMKNVDVSKFDGKVVMALLMGAVRAERFCDGALIGFCKDGSIIKWLERLKDIDQQG